MGRLCGEKSMSVSTHLLDKIKSLKQYFVDPVRANSSYKEKIPFC